MSFSRLDLPKVREKYNIGSGASPAVDFYVEGISCGNCVAKIEKAFANETLAKSIAVNLSRRTVRIGIEPNGKFAPAAEKLRALGFEPKPIDKISDSQQEEKAEIKANLNRVAIAGVLSGNIMLFSFANYAGTEGRWTHLFDLMSGIFFLGILFYCCRPLYKKAWAGIRNKSASIDLPIVASIIIGSGISYYHLFLEKGDVYFDSLATLTFLILASRSILSHYQKKLLSPSYLKDYFKIDVATKILADGTLECVPSEVAPGERLLVKNAEVFPVDAKLESESVWIDGSILTGEAMPVEVHQGEMCYAGTTCLSEQAIVVSTSSSMDSRIGKLVAKVEEQLLSKTPLTSLADRLAQAFTAAVLSIGAIYFLYYMNIDFAEALNRVLALVILACPCALAFATPLGQSIVLSKLARAGIFVKNGEAIEKLSKIETVIFDKTGTLSEGKLQFLGWVGEEPSQQIQSIMFALEKSSNHPVAKSLRDLTQKAKNSGLAVENYCEVIGRGVFGKIDGDEYSITALTNSQPGTIGIGLKKNGQPISGAFFGDIAKGDALKTVSALEQLGLRCFLLSGDKQGSVLPFGTKMGFAKERICAEASPERKLQFIKSQPNSMMVGDGANDLLALAESSVSAAVKGSLEVSLKLADVYIGKDGVFGVVELVRASREAMTIIKRNLGLSIAYNLCGGIAALTGWISPLIAAVLMPLSSVIVVGLTIWGTAWMRSLGKNASRLNSRPNDSSKTSPIPRPEAQPEARPETQPDPQTASTEEAIA